MLTTIHKKLGFDQQAMDSARDNLVRSQMILSEQLDQVLEVPYSNMGALVGASWEFRINSWSEIHGIVKGILEENKAQVGYARQIMFPVEMDGLEAIVGYIKAGLEFKTLKLPVARMVIIIHGVLQVLSGTEKAMKQVEISKQNKSKQFFAGSKIFIEAGESLEYYTAHNVFFITKFYPSMPNENA
ncbi:MAG: hypothetical protein V4714_08330 [Bacteroidota bacterium]